MQVLSCLKEVYTTLQAVQWMEKSQTYAIQWMWKTIKQTHTIKWMETVTT